MTGFEMFDTTAVADDVQSDQDNGEGMNFGTGEIEGEITSGASEVIIESNVENGTTITEDGKRVYPRDQEDLKVEVEVMLAAGDDAGDDNEHSPETEEEQEPEVTEDDATDDVELQRYREHDEELKDLQQQIAYSDDNIKAAKEELKELKAEREGLVIRMTSLVRDFDAKQMRLPFGRSSSKGSSTTEVRDENGDVIDDDDDQTTESGASGPRLDPAKSAPLAELIKFGLTESQCEKWQSADIDTIADFENAVCQNRLGKIVKETKGLGEKSIDKISDAVIAWRVENPVVSAEVGDEDDTTDDDDDDEE